MFAKGFAHLGGGMNFIRHCARTGAKRASSSTCSSSAAGQAAQSKGFMSNPVVKSGLISGSLSLAGDLLAQLLTNYTKEGASSYDAARALRMGSFGLCFYGPYQHYWYSALDKAFPARTVANFATKVVLNQLCLAPLVICGVFAWNLGFQGRINEWRAKVQQDFVPTLMTGWKFWVPAASINFTMVPLKHQVLYMSSCGVLWTGYLSYSSSLSAEKADSGKKNKKK